MNRRDFLGKVAASYVAAGSLFFDNPFRPRFRIAKAANGKTLIVLFQKGGNDGLNTVVPYMDDDYYVHRPTLAIAPPTSTDPVRAIPLDGFFGLNPALAAFEPIYGAGDMVILPTVHYPNAGLSHFDSQLLIESAPSETQPVMDGWLNRHVISHGQHDALLRAMGFSTNPNEGLPDSLRGQAIVSTFGDLTTFGLGLSAADEAELLQRLTPIYDQSADPSKLYTQLVHDFGRAVIDDVALISSIDFSEYTPANGAVYPNSKLGNALKQTAQLITEGVGLEIAAISKNNWDFHQNQGAGNNPNGILYEQLTDFGNSIAALYKDLGDLMTDVVVLTMTEFGRTARENASLGTDHGYASAWFVIGKNVIQGVEQGIYLGSNGWPGLAPEALHLDRALAHTIDYRDVYAEVLTRHLGNSNLATALPGHTYNPVGFLPE